ncbi:MAG: isochorismate synthase [Rubricoccaceae bacterium]|nr:isochorismate synthase [Rubricoccaceae bacterium]
MRPAVSELNDARLRLAAAVDDAFALHRSGIVRVETQVEPLCALTWLHAQRGPDRFYWSGRDDNAMMAGSGISDVIETGSIDDLEEQLGDKLGSAESDVRYVGAIRFVPEAVPSTEWQPFGRIRFALPRVELRAQDDEATIAVHITPSDTKADIERVLDEIVWQVGPLSTGLPSPIGRRDQPEQSTWLDIVSGALQAISSSELEKVVLARRTSLTFDDVLDPFVLLKQVRATTKDCFHMLIEVGQRDVSEAVFVSATPERLFRMDGRNVVSEAVAGTRVNGNGSTSEQVGTSDLLRSEKDRREQRYVVESITSSLDTLTVALQVDEYPSEFNLSTRSHLRSSLKGTLEDGIGAFDLLRLLHPTPAVGGTPTPLALKSIAENEPFDRGLYAGPIGWVGRDSAEFAVGIRSALIRRKEALLYSGAGIVDGSVPENEWDEVEHKLDDFAEVLKLR